MIRPSLLSFIIERMSLDMDPREVRRCVKKAGFSYQLKHHHIHSKYMLQPEQLRDLAKAFNISKILMGDIVSEWVKEHYF